MQQHNIPWTTADMPDLYGKTAIVTGANSGIGFEIALQLYKAGAMVTLACRDLGKAELAASLIENQPGTGVVEMALLDLANLQSVANFSQSYRYQYPSLDILVNNAGIMYPPATLSKEGYELQFATNFLGHFALTASLFDSLKVADAARVVTMCSGAYKRVKTMEFDNLRIEKDYDPTKAYALSKLAGLLFAQELHRRCRHQHIDIASIAAHPGVTRTELQRHIDPIERENRMAIFGEMMEPAQAALPALFAVSEREATSGSYYGPDGENEYVGFPGPAFLTDAAKDPAASAALWRLAEQATGLHFL